jgi:CPA2 family monovalent cation:H+ antiporter-2
VDWLKPWLERRASRPDAGVDAGSIAPATQPGEVAKGLPVAEAEEDGPPPATSQSGHTILIGYGRVGSLVGAALKEAALPFLVIEDGDKTLAALQADGIEAIAGNAARADVFAAANAGGAKRLILAIPNAFEAGRIILLARAANPDIAVVARAHSDAEVEHLKGLGADTVIMGEREIARGIVETVLEGKAEPVLKGEETIPSAPPENPGKPEDPGASAA